MGEKIEHDWTLVSGCRGVCYTSCVGYLTMNWAKGVVNTSTQSSVSEKCRLPNCTPVDGRESQSVQC